MTNKMESYIEYAQAQANLPEDVYEQIKTSSNQETKTQNKTNNNTGAPAHVVIPPPIEKTTTNNESSSSGKQSTRPHTKDRTGEKREAKNLDPIA